MCNEGKPFWNVKMTQLVFNEQMLSITNNMYMKTKTIDCQMLSNYRIKGMP